MPNPWFRLYSEWMDDPKVQIMTEQMQRRLLMLMCEHCKGENYEDFQRAFYWRISAEQLADTKKQFMSLGFIDDNWVLRSWDRRQFLSDNSKERVKRYRDRRENLGLKRGSGSVGRATIFERDSKCCVYCLSPLHLCVDHLVPIQKGGDDDLLNLATACKKCNSGKAGRTPEECGYTIKNADTKERYELYKNGHRYSHGLVTVDVTTPEADTDTEADTETESTLALTSGEAPAGRTPKATGKTAGKELFAKREAATEAGVFDLPLPGEQGEWQVPRSLYTELVRAYPDLGVMEQLAKARLWLVANPTNRKTPKGLPKFLANWMNKAQDSPRNGNRNGSTPGGSYGGKRGNGNGNGRGTDGNDEVVREYLESRFGHEGLEAGGDAGSSDHREPEATGRGSQPNGDAAAAGGLRGSSRGSEPSGDYPGVHQGERGGGLLAVAGQAKRAFIP